MENANNKKKEQKPKVIVVGAGLIGVLTTYWLNYSGKFEVICIEKGPSAAIATSKANAGRFCPSLLGNFAPKYSNLISIVGVKSSSSGGVGTIEWSPSVVSWGIQHLKAATYRQNDINSTLNTLAGISYRLMNNVFVDQKYISEMISPNVWVYSDSTSMKNGKNSLNKTSISNYDELDISKCSWLTTVSETVLMKKNNISDGGGCLAIKSDFTANARTFTENLVEKMRMEKGGEVNFCFNSRVDKIIRNEEGKVIGVELQDGSKIDGDMVVLACGPWSKETGKRLINEDLPIMSARGSSIDLFNVKNAPKVGFSDNTSGSLHFQVTPFEKSTTLRIVGFADAVSPPNKDQLEIDCPSHYRDILINRLKFVLPQVTWEKEGKIWCGLRPMSPDWLPIIGKSGKNQQGIFLNTGHGAIGWTLAASSGYLLCNMILLSNGYQPLGLDKEADNFQMDKLSISRFSLF